MLEERLNQVLRRHGVQLPQVVTSDILSLLTEESKTMMDATETMNATTLDAPMNLPYSSPQINLDTYPRVTQRTDSEAIHTPKLGRYNNLGIDLSVPSRRIFN